MEITKKSNFRETPNRFGSSMSIIIVDDKKLLLSQKKDSIITESQYKRLNARFKIEYVIAQ